MKSALFFFLSVTLCAVLAQEAPQGQTNYMYAAPKVSAPAGKDAKDAAAPKMAAKGKADEAALTPQQKESKRLEKVMVWAKETNPTQAELQAKIYEPVVTGCRKEYDRNLKGVDHYSKLAQEAAEKNPNSDSAKKYRDLAKAYHTLASANASIVKALDKGDGAALEKAFADYKKAEQVIIDETGKAPSRDWFMPSDFQTAVPTDDMAKVGKDGKSLPVAGAKTGTPTTAKPAAKNAPAPKAQ